MGRREVDFQELSLLFVCRDGHNGVGSGESNERAWFECMKGRLKMYFMRRQILVWTACAFVWKSLIPFLWYFELHTTKYLQHQWLGLAL
jgi:hypothetical protein